MRAVTGQSIAGWLLSPAASYLILAFGILFTAVTISAHFSLPRLLNLRQECRMSRMWPSYADYTHEIASPSGLAAKYRLLLYREGYLEPNPEAFPPSGLPALFIPGNAGSHGQVRSVASSSARQYWSHDYDSLVDGRPAVPRKEWEDRHGGVDWWTIDFKEDFSAFHGMTLAEQAVFVNEVIAFLRSTYSTANVTSIPILAHSMGGIVARLAGRLPSYVPRSIETIVTLSTPHAYPPIAYDRGVESVYSIIKPPSQASSHSPDDALIVSIAGGSIDIQVAPEPASLDLLPQWDPRNQLSLFTSAMPALWCSVDHLAIMWCDQLRTRVATGFLRAGLSNYTRMSVLEKRGIWLDTLGLPGEQEKHLPVNDLAALGTLIASIAVDEGQRAETYIILTNQAMSGGDEALYNILVCHSHGAGCEAISSRLWEMLPPSPKQPHVFPNAEKDYRRSGAALWQLKLDSRALRQSNVTQLQLRERVSGIQGAWIKHASSGSATTLQSRPVLLSSAGATIPNQDSGLYQKVSLTQLKHSLLAYDISFRMRSCRNTTDFSPMVRVSTRATKDHVYFPSLSGESDFSKTVSLLGLSPWMPDLAQHQSGWDIEVWYDGSSGCPTAVEEISVRLNKVATLGNLVMRYRTALIAVPFLTSSSGLIHLLNSKSADEAGFTKAQIRATPLSTLMIVASTIVLSIFKRLFPTLPSFGLSLGLVELDFGMLLLLSWVLASIGAVIGIGGATILDGLLGLTEIVVARSSKTKTRPKPKERQAQNHFRDWRTAMPVAISSLAVYAIVPHQVIVLVLFLVHLVTTAAAKVDRKSAGGWTSLKTTHLQQCRALLLALFWCLPIKAPVLFVWAHNALNGWVARHGRGVEAIRGGDHNPFEVISFFLVVQLLADGTILAGPGQRTLASASLTLIQFLARFIILLFGFRRPFLLTDVTNALCCTILAFHFFATNRSKISDSDQGSEFPMSQPLLSSHEDVDNNTPRASLEAPRVSALQIPQSLVQQDAVAQTDKDEKLRQLLQTIEEYQAQKMKAAQDMAAGFIMLGKAKSSAGGWLGSRIGRDGYDARLRAHVKCEIASDGRVRLKPALLSESSQGSTNAAEGEQGPTPKRPPDPLYQFSALPPAALRQAQVKFKEALEGLLGQGGSDASVFGSLINIKSLESELAHV